MANAPVRSFIQARDPSVDRRYRPRPLRQVNLINLIAEDDDEDNWTDTQSENDIEFTVGSLSSGINSTNTECALVYLRLRPVQDRDATSTSYIPQGNILVTRNSGEKGPKGLVEKHFTFTDILDATTRQASVYDTCIRQSIEAEESLTILTYGTSGAGKTYTHIGDAEDPGLIPRALEHIFSFYGRCIEEIPYMKVIKSTERFLDNTEVEDNVRLRHKMLVADSKERYNHDRLKSLIKKQHCFTPNETIGKKVFVWISFAEIYNEFVYDLLNPNYEQQVTKKKGLTIVSNKGRVFIKNLTSVFVRNSFEANLLLKIGTQRVTFGSTAVNNHSSRSHFVFFVDVITTFNPDYVSFHSYKFCDLAGSERLDKTKNIGNRLKEAQRINTSLLVLGRCLDAVYHNQQKKNADVVPFRESKLTTLLQSPLIGKEKMTMIVNINPSDEYFEENLHVLSFASIAKNIVFKQIPKKEVRRSRYSWLAKNPPFNNSGSQEVYEELRNENKMLNNEIERLTEEIIQLERKLTNQEIDVKRAIVSEYEVRLQRQDEHWKRRLDSEKNYYEQRIRLLEEQLKNKSTCNVSSVYVSDSESNADSGSESDSEDSISDSR